MSPNTQKAVLVHELGKPVRLGQREIPTPKAGELVVKVTSAQVLPHDAYGRDYGLFIADKLPCVLGSSLAGIVEQIGPEPSESFRVGDRVFGISNVEYPTADQAALQQYAILQTDSIAHVPKTITNDEAATLPVNIATVAITLFTKVGFELPAPWQDKPFDLSTEPVVLLGGGTNAAKLFTRVAFKVLGMTNIIAVASLSNKSELEVAGASHVIDRHLPEEEVIAQVHRAAGGADNVTRIFDCASWNHSLAAALLAINKASRLVTLHPVDEKRVRQARPLARANLVYMTNANLAPHAKSFWQALPRWIEAGIVRPTSFWTVDGLQNVDAINEQLDKYAAGRGGPQLIVHP